MSAPADLPVSPSGRMPQCVVVAGPARKETWAWIERKLRSVREAQPAARLALLAADADVGQLRAIARSYAPIEIRRLMVPCACCPALTNLPSDARELAEEFKPDWLIVELPVLAATALLAHFDSSLHWPREFVVCLDERWAAARRDDQLTWFQSQLLQSADLVADPETAG